MKKLLLFIIGILLAFSAYGQSKLPPCGNFYSTSWSDCFGTQTFAGGDKYFGEFKGGKYHGQGTYIFSDGRAPNEGIFEKGLFVRAEKINLTNDVRFTWPTEGKIISFFDQTRKGIDIAGEAGQAIVAVGSGTVLYATNMGGYGNLIIVDHSDGLVSSYSSYAHNKTILVREGQNVAKGQRIAEMGNSDSDIVKLNFQMRKDRKPVDPVSLLPPREDNNQSTKIDRVEKINPPSQQTDLALNGERRLSEVAKNQQSNLPTCQGSDATKWSNCFGAYTFSDGFKYVGTKIILNGSKFEGEWRGGNPIQGRSTFTYVSGDQYVGELKDGKIHGQGTFTFSNGDKYVGGWKDGKYHGQGIATFADGRSSKEGIWADNKFVRVEKINLPNQQTDLSLNEERRSLEADRQALAERERRFDEERRSREQAKQSSRLAIQANTTVPDANGFVVITIQTNADTSSLKINGEEQGGKPDGNYSVRKVARVGQETKYTIVALDSNGNTDTKTVAVTRQAASTDIIYAALNPVNIKQQPSRDAVAIIIGIQNYKRVAKAPYANDDARAFYDYAIRALGIKPQNIKLLVDEEADEIEIIQAFENWLPVHVNKNKTEVYVFYAGHGLPSTDGKSLYFLPYGVDKQYLARTAVGQKEVIAALAASKPKTVTMFIDACYSGSTRSGEILVADARPVNLKVEGGIYPPNFTVISASANDQISSSSPELKHGIFSFYLMKGMEGDADGNKDGKITVGEMQEYLSDKVSRQAMTKNAQQDTQLVGDATRVLVTR